jgi:hypothetical protein
MNLKNKYSEWDKPDQKAHNIPKHIKFEKMQTNLFTKLWGDVGGEMYYKGSWENFWQVTEMFTVLIVVIKAKIYSFAQFQFFIL